MANKHIDMQAIFSELSETNQDIILLLAKGVKVAQSVTIQQKKQKKCLISH